MISFCDLNLVLFYCERKLNLTLSPTCRLRCRTDRSVRPKASWAPCSGGLDGGGAALGCCLHGAVYQDWMKQRRDAVSCWGGELCALWLEGDLLCRRTLVCNQQGRVKAAPAGRWLSRLLNPEVMQLLNFVWGSFTDGLKELIRRNLF